MMRDCSDVAMKLKSVPTYTYNSFYNVGLLYIFCIHAYKILIGKKSLLCKTNKIKNV